MSLLRYFSLHRVAGNIVMLIVILAGVWGFQQLSFQLFPTFTFNSVSVITDWDDASSEDVHQSITLPVESALLGLAEVQETRASSSEGRSNVRVTLAGDLELEDVERLFDETLATVSLPEAVETPDVRQYSFSETVGAVLLYGDAPVSRLSGLARDAAAELRRAGLTDVSVDGAVSETLSIRVSQQDLLNHGLTLDTLATLIQQQNQDLPAGALERNGQSLQMRAQGQTRMLTELADLSLGPQYGSVRLGDIARFSREVARDEDFYYRNQPAVRINVSRQPDDNSLAIADTLNDWIADAEPGLPEGVQLHTYRNSWESLSSRLGMVLENGLLGMVLVLAVLFFFLNARLAFWVAAGIPVSFMATFLFMGISGMTINMISLFGFMIAIGIIVDDAIVVAEDTQALREHGQNSGMAAVRAAQRMFPAVLAASLTTIAAFLPLTLVDGRFGRLMADIPLVVTAAILASLVECFIILPAHLHHGLKQNEGHQPGRFRRTVDNGFRTFRENFFRPLAHAAIRHGTITLASVLALALLTVGLIRGDHVPWTPFPDLEGSQMTARVDFTPDSTPEQVVNYLNRLESALYDTEQALNYDFVDTAVFVVDRDDLDGRIDVELRADPDRPVTSDEIVRAWRSRMPEVSGLEELAFTRTWGGFGNADVTVRLSGDDIDTLKSASVTLQARLTELGLTEVADDLPYGPDQLVFQLSPEARALGLNLTEISQYLRRQMQTHTVQTFIVDGEEIPLELTLSEAVNGSVRLWESLPYPLADGGWMPLESLLESEYQQGLDRVQSTDGETTIEVTASLADPAQQSATLTRLENEILPAVSADTGVPMTLAGESTEEEETARALWFALAAALLLMYLILTWVFAAWTWPLVVLVTIPFGLIGALFGHWVLGLPLSFLSLFGLFGLSGIVVNDSIVLLTFFRRLRDSGMDTLTAAVEAACQRLRAVLMTSITTMAGLTPLLFDTSLDAQFLRPMAAGLVFGLMFSTVLILLLVPTLLVWLEKLTYRPARL